MTRRISAAALYVLAVFFLATILAVYVVWIGARHLVGSDGALSADCAKEEYASVPNGAGIVATAHQLYCTGLATTATTYVYVHRRDELDSPSSLVFRFDNADSDPPPNMAWTNPTTLELSISEVGEITRQLNSIGSVRIAYRIRIQDVAAGTSFRQNERFEGESLLVLAVFVGALILTVRVLKRYRDLESA